MYRLLKKIDDSSKIEIITDKKSFDEITQALKECASEYASNGEDYTSCDFERMVEQEYARIGNYILSIDEVSTISKEEFISNNGEICPHCHSKEVFSTDVLLQDGDKYYKVKSCDICNEDTEVVYSLSGFKID